MAGEGQPYHNRIADLLDDITVGTEDVPQAASPGLAAAPTGTSAATSPAVLSGTPPGTPGTPANLPAEPILPANGTSTPANKDEPGRCRRFCANLRGRPNRVPPCRAQLCLRLLPKGEYAAVEQPALAADGDGTHTATIPSLPAAAASAVGAQGETQAAPQAQAVVEASAEGDATDGAATVVAGETGAVSPETATPPGPPISIKGRSDGLVIEIGKGSWSEMLAALDDRLQQSASFFRNARVAVDLGTRSTTEAELMPLVDLLKTHGLTLASVRTSTERTFQAALALGLTTTLESAEGVPVADAAPAVTNTSLGAYFVYRGYLRSGHRLQRKESVLVIGDVNPGAEVSSEGDVLVWGRLRGVVHAGAKGNLRAIVAALDLEPTQLRIADVMTIGPDPRPGQPGKWFWKRSANKRPEIARIANETISIEEWDATRPGGIVSLRRGGKKPSFLKNSVSAVVDKFTRIRYNNCAPLFARSS